MKKLIIKYDYTDGNEFSYGGLLKHKGTECGSIATHCLDFFLPEHLSSFDDIVVVKETGEYISLVELLQNTGEYTEKEVRKEHNLPKMLKAGTFKFKVNQQKE